MPYFFKIDRSINVVFIRHIGVVSTADLCNQLVEIAGQNKYQPGMNLLFDHREEVPPDLGHSRAEEFAVDDLANQTKLKNILSLYKNIRMACIVEKEMVQYFNSLLKLMQEVGEVENKVFFNVNEAKEWLDIPASYNVDEILKKIIFITGYEPSTRI
jgi:hypothetical protein